MKQKPPRWVQITAAVLRRYLALDMTVYAGSATLFLLTASFPLLMWVLMLVNLVPGFSVEGVAELLADFLPQIPEIQTAILGLLQNLSGQSAQFVASLAVLTTIVSASGGMNALQIGLQRLTPGSHRTLLNRLLRSQLPGTIFATAGWLIFSRVFSFYILHFWRLSYIYGSLTAVILVILWLYVIINLLFLGAGVNAEMNGKTEQ